MEKYSNKDILIVTGGAGFVGSHLIELLIKKTDFKIISIDNYYSGSKTNHIINKKVKYIKANTIDIEKTLKNYKKKILTIFHFGEFSRIFRSFEFYDDCIKSNLIGTASIFKFCLENKIKLVYSATSASVGNKGDDKNLSPYAFTKSKNLEMLNNFKKWFKFDCEVIYFYNVYGERQIRTGKMATIIGIFEHCYSNNLPMPVVRPGTQTRRFTHIRDTVEICYLAWKKNKSRHYSISHKKKYSILQVAKMFGKPIKFLPKRKGERFASALTKMHLNNRIYRKFGKLNLKKYINDFKLKSD